MSDNTNTAADNTPKWYVVHTYSGYENKVMSNLEKAVENNGLTDCILEVKVPIEEVAEIKNGKRRMVQHKIYPGYVLVRMIMTDEAWYLVRNTRGVTGFVGPGSKPVPLTEEEIAKMNVEGQPVRIDLTVGDTVTVLDGPLKDFSGVIEELDTTRQKARIRIAMFGKNTLTDVDLDKLLRN